MLPAYYSLQNQKKNNITWIRSGSNVKYFKNNIQIENSKRFYFTLTFNINTPYENDVLRIAQCYPYTYTDLNNFLTNLQKVNHKKQLLLRETIYKTIAKNKIQALIIKQANLKLKKQNRPLIFVLARQHPGETPGSFVVEGMIQYFLSKDKDSQFLRKNYQIRVIPMINPDGVIQGNYRANLLGYDLNRKWDCSLKQTSKIQCQVTHIKKYINYVSKNREVAFIIDLHGHSRKMFSFFYGNCSNQSPSDVRIFPFICSKLSPMIRFQDSTFNVEQGKRRTARIQMFLNQKIYNIFTFQSSFFGYLTKNREKKHFTVENYKNLGLILCKAINIHERRKQEGIDGKQKMLFEKLLKQLKSNIILMKSGQNVDSGSQSCPEQYQIQDSELKILQQEQSYLNKSPSKVPSASKFNKKKIKQDIIEKQIQKKLRHMKVLDIARVNPVFPNDFLALVPSNFFNKSKNLQFKNMQVQTTDCPLIRIYESCKRSQDYEKSFLSSPLQTKSTFFQRNKSKSIGDYCSINLNPKQNSNLFQNTISNFSNFPVQKNRCFTHENSRNKSVQLSVPKKLSSSIRSNFHIYSTQKRQIVKPKMQYKLNRNSSTQTQIFFNKDTILKYEQINTLIQQNKQSNNGFLTIQPMRKTIMFESKQFKNRQFRRTLIKATQIDNWRLKKKNPV